MNVAVLEPEHLTRLDAWLRCVLWESKLPGSSDDSASGEKQIEIHRLKARLPLSDGQVKLVQGVREIFEILDAPASSGTSFDASMNTLGKIVLIGRHLLNVPFEESFKNMIESST